MSPKCPLTNEVERFAQKVMSAISEEQLDRLNLIEDFDKEDAQKAIEVIVNTWFQKEPSRTRKAKMLSDVDAFLNDLDTFFTTINITEDEKEEAEEQREELMSLLNVDNKERFSKINYFSFAEDDEEQQEQATIALTVIGNLRKAARVYVSHYRGTNKIKGISIVQVTPKIVENKSAQQKAIDSINRISEIPKELIGYTTINGTSYAIYNYNGKTVLTRSVSMEVYEGEDTSDIPILATPIGDQVDAVGKDFFNRGDPNNRLYKDGKLITDEGTTDEEIQAVIDFNYKGVYTIQGLRNLVNDFKELEKEFNNRWGIAAGKKGNVRVISKDVHLFAQNSGKDSWVRYNNQLVPVWTQGKPDLLVVDADGIVHPVDMKSYKISDYNSYTSTIVGDAFNRDLKYAAQESRYIGMLESYGLQSDQQPYVVLIDTFYDGKDKPSSQKHVYEIRRKNKKVEYIGVITEDNEGNKSSILLREYAEQNGNPTREDIFGITENTDSKKKSPLYIEPRLRVKAEIKDGKRTISKELNALRGEGELELDSRLSYEEQVEALDPSDRAELLWVTGPVMHTAPTHGIIALSSSYIDSRPDIIGSVELKHVSHLLMYQVSTVISRLCRGEEEGPFKLEEEEVGKLSRRDVIAKFEINKIIDYVFEQYIAENKETFPTLDDYKNGNYNKRIYRWKSEEDYQKALRKYTKRRWLTTHKKQLITWGEAKLLALEDSLHAVKVPSSQKNGKGIDSYFALIDGEDAKDAGDNDSLSSFADRFIEGLTDTQAWMIGARHYSNKASLAAEMRRLYESIEMCEADDEGKIHIITDSYGYGFPMHIDTVQAMQATLELCKNCETIEEMMKKLEQFASSPKNVWMKSIIDALNNDNKLKIKFFRHFRKDALTYSISEVRLNKATGQQELITRVINRKSTYSTMMQQLGADFLIGDVGVYTINGEKYNVISDHAITQLGNAHNPTLITRYIRTDIETLQTILSGIYSGYARERNPSKRETWFKDKFKKEVIKDDFSSNGRLNGLTFIQALTNVLQGIGILVDEKTFSDELLYDISTLDTSRNASTSNIGKILSSAITVIDALNTQNKTGIPAGLSGNKAFAGYQPIVSLLADSVQERVEASVYQDGKTYYSYSNPSKLGHIIRNLKDAINDPEKFGKYIENEFGRYNGWFKSADGKKWLCDWVKQLESDESARAALDHKDEISFIGNQYKNLGALGFQLSILTNYFGSRTDRYTQGKDLYRWFALPTMSNKPTNEFIRFRIYNEGTFDRTKKAIVDRVLMNTFTQECNRIADVLDHYTRHHVAIDQIDLTDDKLGFKIKEGDDEEVKKKKIREKEAFINRIKTHSITGSDLKKLAKLKSGAKFHFLWYLNNEILEDADFADKLSYKINMLLTKEEDKSIIASTSKIDDANDTARKLIEKNMDIIVENELKEMEKIGLFDKEQVRIKNSDGKSAMVTVLKYQKRFNGNLGAYDEDSVLKASKEELEKAKEDALKSAEKQMKDKLTEFIWQDVAANINIIQITGGDLAYYGDAINYQKRIAQIHSPGWHLMSMEDTDDGFLRSVHISDLEAVSEATQLAIDVLNEYMEHVSNKDEYKKMISIIEHGFNSINVTDGQSLNCITSIKKKLIMQGEWDDEMREAYNKIKKGDFSINNLMVLMQPRKPFATADLAKYSGSRTMDIRKVPLQDKNSEYLIILAEALAEASGKRSKLAAINAFMEQTAEDTQEVDDRGIVKQRKGIDTVHFASVGKVGVSGIIDINAFDEHYAEVFMYARDHRMIKNNDTMDSAYNELLKRYMLEHVRRDTNTPIRDIVKPYNKENEEQAFTEEKNLLTKGGNWYEGTLRPEEVIYNNRYVDTIPVEAYIIQQEVPAHLFEREQLYGSQIRILGISDITPGTEFLVNGEKMTDKTLTDEYMNLHAENIRESYNDLMRELGLVDSDNNPLDLNSTALNSMDPYKRDEALKNLEYILQKELSKDSKYGFDIRRACTLVKGEDGHYIDFVVPLFDPIQSSRIQMLINSIIKKTINKQKIKGGSLVQVTAYDNDLNIRFKDQNGKPLMLRREYAKHEGLTNEDEINKAFRQYLNDNKASIAYFECYASIPDARLEKLITKEDGTLMTMKEIENTMPKEVLEALTSFIGYRIPTEDKYSMLPLKIVGFLPKAAGQAIMMPKEITLLTGSDFDIDKMFIMLKSFNYNIEDEDLAYLAKDISAKMWNLIGQYTGKIKRRTSKAENDKFFDLVKTVVKNGNRILRGNREANLDDGIEKEGLIWEYFEPFIEWYRERMLSKAFEEIKINKDNNAEKAKRARDNRILDLEWAVLTNRDTAVKMLNPGNFEGYTKTASIIKVLKSKAKKDNNNYYTLEDLLEIYDEAAERDGAEEASNAISSLAESASTHNTTLPSSKIYFQQQNMQGTQMVGIFANHMVSHAFCSFENIYIDLKKLSSYDGSFAIGGVTIGGDVKTRLDPIRNANGTLVSKIICSATTASVDTAKKPVLRDMNITTFTGAMAATMIRMGYDELTVGMFLSQPIIEKISEVFFKKRNEGWCNAETAIKMVASDLGISDETINDMSTVRDTNKLTVSNLAAHLNDDIKSDYQTDVLKAFYGISKISNDVQELTFLTKFNSVSNAVGPLISDTMEDMDRVTAFKEGIKSSCFSTDTSKNHTNPADIIDRNPILKEFFECTLGKNGASEKIFQNFFPHYFKGFREIKETFKREYLKGDKISSKLYNQLLNDYIYFALTLAIPSDREGKITGFKPTIPSSEDEKRDIVDNIVDEFREVKALLKSKGKPNMLIDETLGGNCLRIRKRDEYVSRDTLVFNGGQLDSDAQQEVRDAWSDLITMNDSNMTPEENNKIRDFGVKLFFYTLMRNGFNFSPKTMMHLSSVLVRYNAQYNEEMFESYINGISNLRQLDAYISNDEVLKTRFYDQFIRNHIGSKNIVPNFSESDKHLYWGENGIISFRVKSDKIHELSDLMLDRDSYCKYITITSREGRRLKRTLYRQVERGVEVRGDETIITYQKTEELGFTNNFIEYNANIELSKSFFKEMRDTSEDSLIDEEDPMNGERDEDLNIEDLDVKSQWDRISRIIKGLQEKEGIEENLQLDVRKKIKKVFFEGTDNEMLTNIKSLLDERSEKEHLETLKEITDKCV